MSGRQAPPRMRTHSADDAPLARLLRLEADAAQLRGCLEGLYEATHAYLDASLLRPQRRGELSDRAAALNGALADAFEALHAKGRTGRP